MTDLYCMVLELPHEKIHGKIFNAGYENFKNEKEIAQMVKNVVGDIEIRTEPTDDNRSYHISSELIKRNRL